MRGAFFFGKGAMWCSSDPTIQINGLASNASALARNFGNSNIPSKKVEMTLT